MASESTEEGTVTVTLPAELEDWLEEQTSDADLDRDEFLVQLLSSYRATADLDGELEGSEGLAVEFADTETVLEVVEPSVANEVADAIEEELPAAVSDELDGQLETAIQEQLEGRVEQLVDDAVDDRLNQAAEALQNRLGGRMDTLEANFDEKIQDVRDRVIQVKQEADTKAPAEHDHEQLSAIEDLTDRIDTVEAELETATAELEAVGTDQEERLAELESDFAELKDRLQTVAWVVSDLREAYESSGGQAALERIKRSAAEADISRAKCENCGDGVEIALLSEPQCPHCQATVTNVEPASGFFGNPQLLVASQLESGENR